MTARTFESGPARRERTRVSIGFVGYSGSGKTFSMLRFASGMGEAQGGKTVLVDSNLRRSLYYAPKPGESAVRGQTFDFEVVHLTPPFDPASWRSAFEHAIVKLGATRVLVDCMSDEWEGQGGVLDQHDALIDEMIGRKRQKGDQSPDWKLHDQLSDSAWIPVKAAHRSLRMWMWQQPVDWLLSYRAKKKIDRKSKERVELGWQPIGADDIIYDLLFKCLLPPAGDGRPVWRPKEDAEQLLVKQPGQFRALLAAHPQIDEELGRQIARWAAGLDIDLLGTATSSPASSPGTHAGPPAVLADRLDAARDGAELAAVEADIPAAWAKLRQPERDAINAAGKRAHARVKASAAASAFRSDGGAASAGAADPPIDNDEATEIAAIEAEEARRQLLEQEQGGEHG